MACAECGQSEADRVRVEYSTGSTERLVLCPDCREEYRNGGMVSDVSVVGG